MSYSGTASIEKTFCCFFLCVCVNQNEAVKILVRVV